MNRVNLFLLSVFTCVGWRGECLAGNDLGLSSTNELQEWTLEKQETEQVTFRLADTLLKLRPLTNNAVRVIRSTGIAHEVPELVYLPKKVPDYVLKKEKDGYILSLKNLNVRFSVSDGRISFFSSGGKEIVGEEASLIESSSVQGEKTYVSTQTFHSPFDECLYGLGQFQDGYLNVRGLTRRLTQVNTQIAIPFVMSNKGYGLLWNNYGLTDFNPASSVVALQKTGLGGNKVTVNVTSTEGGKEEVRESNVFAGKLKVESDGQYALMLDVGSVMARRHNLAIDGHTVVDMNNLWLPPTVSILVDLKAGEHNLRAELTKEDAPKVYFRKVDETTTFRSPVSNGIDYTFFAGTADEVIASYREATGEVPRLPAWALGYIHCRERFHSPIVEEGPVVWKTYLPAVQGGWYDFHDNQYMSTGWVQTSVSPDYIPVFVKAGTVLPLSSGYEENAQKALKSDLEIRVYAGTDGTYQLYEDEGTDYNYQKGGYSCIRLFWDDAHSILIIGKRSGQYEGMEPVRNLKIVKIALSSDGKSNVTEKSVVYKGEELKIAF